MDTQQSPKVNNRKCSEEKQGLKEKRENRSIYIPIDKELYEVIIDDPKAFRVYVDECRIKYPELFPELLSKGYHCIGCCRESKKMPELSLRRIRTKGENEQGKAVTYQIVPCYVLPYMRGYVEEVEKAMYLHFKYNVPFDGLVYAYGKNEMYWYRLSRHLGSYSVVGTTVKDKEKLPQDLAADEKHSHWNGETAYVATTVAQGCILGASVSLGADESSLNESYGVFKEESQDLDKEYEPKTVNTDGFKSTLKAWSSLFIATTLIPCFLHGFLKIRNHAKRLSLFHELSKLVWDAFHQNSYDAFIDKITYLEIWTKNHQQDLSQRCLDAVNKLIAKAHDYAQAYDHPNCHRTSNMLDRLMQKMDRYLFITRYFHGHLHSAELGIRAWALAQNFLPYCSRSSTSKTFRSPAHKLNGFTYRDNWLENLLVSSSCTTKLPLTHIPLE